MRLSVTRTGWRRLIGALAGAIAIGVPGLLWLAAPETGVPWSSRDRLELPADVFEVVGGQPTADGEALLIDGADADGRSLLMAPTGFDASHFRYLQMDLPQLPTRVRVQLAWSGTEGPKLAALPFVRGRATIDLESIEGWQGRVERLGVLIVPADLAPVPATLQRQVRFGGLELLGESRAAAVAGVISSWYAYRPWTGRSINTGGFELPIRPQMPLLLWMGLCALGAALGAVLVAPDWRAVGRAALWSLLALWLVRDGLQLRQLALRTIEAVTIQHHSGSELGEASLLPGLQPSVQALGQHLRSMPHTTRVLTWGEGPFFRQYPAFLLREFDVGALPSPQALPRDAGAQPAVLVLGPSAQWTYDPAGYRLSFGGRELPAVSLELPGPLAGFVLREGSR